MPLGCTDRYYLIVCGLLNSLLMIGSVLANTRRGAMLIVLTNMAISEVSVSGASDSMAPRSCVRMFGI